MSEIVNRRDLDFLLFEFLDLEDICKSEKFEAYDRGAVEEILNTAQTIAEEKFLPFATMLDANEPKFVDGKAITAPELGDSLRAFAEAGFFAAGFDEDVGGLQMPNMLGLAVNGMFSAASPTVQGYTMLTAGAANMLNTYGSDEQKSIYLPPMLEGRWFGTMCLSETHAGSSLSDIRTKAEPRGDGSYNISGTKMWISGGEQEISENIVHMVLARIPGGPPGVKGISLLIVPKFRVTENGGIGERNNIVLAGLNHKMGQRGLTNTLLNFGEGGDTIGYLVGEPHHGLAYMFHMMNEARISVGHGATMSGLTGFLHSLDYARSRLQGRHPQDKDPESKQVAIIEHADVRRMLFSQKCWVEGSLALLFYCTSLIDQQKISDNADEKKSLELLLDILTPIAKSYPSEFCLEANKLAIQILGGYGYTRDFPVERYYRDNRLNHIHEGTYAIHGIDLLGRKVRMHGGAAFKLLLERIQETISRADRGSFPTEAAVLQRAVDHLKDTTQTVIACDDITLALANATCYLEAMGQIVIAWIWLGQAMSAVGNASELDTDKPFYAGKVAAMRFYFRYELPKAAHYLNLVASLDDLTVHVDAAEFTGV